MPLFVGHAVPLVPLLVRACFYQHLLNFITTITTITMTVFIFIRLVLRFLLLFLILVLLLLLLLLMPVTVLFLLLRLKAPTGVARPPRDAPLGHSAAGLSTRWGAAWMT